MVQVDLSHEEIDYIKSLILKGNYIKKSDSDKKEKLSELEHEQWIEWSKNIAETEKITEERLKRWKKLWIPYQKLSETDKDKDREWADKVLSIIEGNEIKKSVVVPDPTQRDDKARVVDAKGFIAPLATVGTPLAESDDKRKELLGRLMKKAEDCGYVNKQSEFVEV